jgi:hypothetical protein
LGLREGGRNLAFFPVFIEYLFGCMEASVKLLYRFGRVTYS